MTPRNRKAENEGLPDNLYFYGGYYKYRSPITKVSVGLGADKKHAFEKAKYYNAQVLLKIDALSKVIGGDKTTWADLVFRFRAERQNIIGNKE